MSRRPHSLRLNNRVLAVLVLVALPLLAVGGIVVLGIGQRQLRDNYATHLARIAERTAAAVDAFVFRRIIDVSLMARIPDIRAEAVSATRQPVDADAARKIDDAWQAQRTPPSPVAGILQNDASLFLRDVVQNDPIYSELLLADGAGRLAAASNVTSDYLQVDEEWWREVMNSRRVHLGDVYWDESARTHAIEISVPVFAPGSDDLVGALKAVTSAREMLAAVSGLRLGDTGEAALVRKDGSLVYSRRSVEPGAQFFSAALLREWLGLSGPVDPTAKPSAPQPDRATDPQFRAHFSAQTPEGGRALVAVAPTQLGISYPTLPWLVAVYQAEAELFAPVRSQVWYFLALLAIVALTVLAIALWFSVRLAAPPLDVDMQLVEHARIPRIDEEEEPNLLPAE